MHVKHQLCKPSEDLEQEFDFYCGQTSRFLWWGEGVGQAMLGIPNQHIPGQQTVSEARWPEYLRKSPTLLSQQMGELPWGVCFVSIPTPAPHIAQE